MIDLATERDEHGPAIERLLDAAFGDARWTKTCQRLRDGQQAIRDLSLVALDGDQLIGTVRLWPITVGRRPGLLLGPLAVDPDWRERTVGGRLMVEALNRAKLAGEGAVFLVGDAPYYRRFGFRPEPTRKLRLPGPVDRERFLACELKPGATDGLIGDVIKRAA